MTESLTPDPHFWKRGWLSLSREEAVLRCKHSNPRPSPVCRPRALDLGLDRVLNPEDCSPFWRHEPRMNWKISR